jgi:hypothetical protein
MSWSAPTQGPVQLFGDFWSFTMGDMLISVLGLVTTYNGNWSAPAQGPTGGPWQCAMGNMLINIGGLVSTYTNGNWSAPTQGPVPLIGGGLWQCTMGNMVISAFGRVSTYTQGANPQWSATTQGPVPPTGDAWMCTMGNMVISGLGEVSTYTQGANPQWSAATQGPVPPTNDFWRCTMGNMLISQYGKVSTYTQGANPQWSAPAQGPAQLSSDIWRCTMGNMLISSGGYVSTYPPGPNTPMFPLTLSLIDVSDTSATISWTGGLSGSKYSLCMGDSSYDTNTDTTFTLDDLEPNTTYTVNVYGTDPSIPGPYPQPSCTVCPNVLSTDINYQCRSYGTITFTTNCTPCIPPSSCYVGYILVFLFISFILLIRYIWIQSCNI